MIKLPPRYKDITGQRFGRWVAIRFDKKTTFSAKQKYGKKAYWLFRCDCGTTRILPANRLKFGDSTSCGCYHREIVSTNGGRTKRPYYRIWRNMVQRCTNPKDFAYNDYGGRGINVFKAWLHYDEFEKYLEEALGKRPSAKYSLDRIDNNAGYFPDNIKWSTRKEQARNKRIPKSLQNYSDKELLAEVLRRKL